MDIEIRCGECEKLWRIPLPLGIETDAQVERLFETVVVRCRRCGTRFSPAFHVEHESEI